MSKLYFWALGALALGAVSCGKDVEDIRLEPEFAVPLFSATSRLEDLFGENTDTSELLVAPNGDMTIIYRGNIVRREANEIFAKIPPFPGLMNDTILKQPFKLENQVNVIRAKFTNGLINVQVTSNIPEDLNFYLEFPEVTLGGETLKIPTEIKYTGSPVTVVTIPPTSCTGYDIFLGGNEITVRYVATKKSTGERVKLPNVVFLITNVEFSYMEGYFGYELREVDRDTITMDIFREIIQGNLQFADPRVTVIVENSFGFPLRGLPSVLRVSNGGAFADLESPVLATGFDFDFPNLQQVGQSRLTKFYFDRNNSNIKDILNLRPIYLDYKLDAISNPDTISSLVGFTTDSSYFSVGVQVELPLEGKAEGFEAGKEYDVDFTDIDASIRKAELKLVTENGLPLEVLAQLTLLDDAGNVLGTLLPGFGEILRAAPIDAQGYATGKSRKETFIPVDADLLDDLRQTRRVRIDTRFTTSNMGKTDVKIRSTDEVDVRMGIRATLDTTLGG